MTHVLGHGLHVSRGIVDAGYGFAVLVVAGGVEGLFGEDLAGDGAGDGDNAVDDFQFHGPSGVLSANVDGASPARDAVLRDAAAWVDLVPSGEAVTSTRDGSTRSATGTGHLRAVLAATSRSCSSRSRLACSRAAIPGSRPALPFASYASLGGAPFQRACVCSIESGPCERVESLRTIGRFWSTSACGEK